MCHWERQPSSLARNADSVRQSESVSPCHRRLSLTRPSAGHSNEFAQGVLKALAIPERQSDAIAEGVEKVVLPVVASVADAKALDLVKQVISGVALVDNRLFEGSVRVLDPSSMHIT